MQSPMQCQITQRRGERHVGCIRKSRDAKQTRNLKVNSVVDKRLFRDARMPQHHRVVFSNQINLIPWQSFDT